MTGEVEPGTGSRAKETLTRKIDSRTGTGAGASTIEVNPGIQKTPKLMRL